MLKEYGGFMEDLRCPYCEKDNEVPDECYDQHETYECECSKCGKVFVFTLEYERIFYEEQCPLVPQVRHFFSG